MVTAERQTAGRGRQGRAWSSPPGNLYASCCCARRARWPAASSRWWSRLRRRRPSGLFDARPPRVKWPNDVLLDGAKLAGIRSRGGRRGRRLRLGDRGLGVNLAASRRPALRRHRLARATGRAWPTPDAFLDALAPPAALPTGRSGGRRLRRAAPGLARPRPPARVRGQPAARRRADQRPLRRSPRRRLDRPGATTAGASASPPASCSSRERRRLASAAERPDISQPRATPDSDGAGRCCSRSTSATPTPCSRVYRERSAARPVAALDQPRAHRRRVRGALSSS